MEPILSGPGPAGDADLIKDATSQTFMADVIEASRTTPVIVDFWAPWCGPCKQLGPALEKVVREAGGAVKLVKVNIDENQDIAQQLRVQSIPAVFAFDQGQPVDAFVGALPESQIREFVQRLGGPAGPSPIDEAVAQAKEALEAGDHATAGALFGRVLEHEPGNVSAVAGLARCHTAAGQFDKARELLGSLPEEVADNPDVAAARSALELQESTAGAAGDTAALRDRLAADENDHEARLELANALYAAGDAAAAIDELLDIVQRDRKWNDEAARLQLVKIFEALGHGHELTVAGRRRLSSLLFS